MIVSLAIGLSNKKLVHKINQLGHIHLNCAGGSNRLFSLNYLRPPMTISGQNEELKVSMKGMV